MLPNVTLLIKRGNYFGHFVFVLISGLIKKAAQCVKLAKLIQGSNETKP